MSTIVSAAAVDPVSDFYRCPAGFAAPSAGHRPSGSPGYFRFGRNTICYGRSSAGSAMQLGEDLCDAAAQITTRNGMVELPFDPAEVVENLRRERYVANGYPGGRPLLS